LPWDERAESALEKLAELGKRHLPPLPLPRCCSLPPDVPIAPPVAIVAPPAAARPAVVRDVAVVAIFEIDFSLDPNLSVPHGGVAGNISVRWDMLPELSSCERSFGGKTHATPKQRSIMVKILLFFISFALILVLSFDVTVNYFTVHCQLEFTVTVTSLD
jgi:hypothetical protein